MNRDELIAALQALDRALLTECELLVVGGAAMMLYFGARRATQDVDALLLRGDGAELIRAVATVARELGLPLGWLNDAVKGFADILPRDFGDRLIRLDLGTARLRLYALGRVDQTAMKIVALREQDLEDLDLLLPGLSTADRGILARTAERLAAIRPDWAQKMRYFLLEQGWEID